MNAQQLKNSILQEAISGRLVPQDPNDEPASALLQRIRKEKAQLVKQGKLKKKDLEETPISDEDKPFDIPDSWEWVRIPDIGVSQLGKTKNPNQQSGLILPYLCSINVYWEGINLSQTKEMLFEESEIDKYSIKKGDLLICEGGDCGRSAIWDNNNSILYQNALHRVRFFGNIDSKYILYCLYLYKNRNLLDNYIKGETIRHLVKGELDKIIFPLPPLAEQKRIVAKIEELMPKVEEYGKAQEALDKLNSELPDKLKKSILQEAISGRLVPQDAADEPASTLLQRIRQEKAQLVKQGKLKKKDLEETPISDEEKPFDIPDSWEWVRIGYIFNHSSGKQLSAIDTEGTLHEYITTSNLYWEGFVLENLKSMYYKDSELERCTAKKGDLLVCEGGDIGRSAIWPYDYDICLQNHVHRLRPYIQSYTLFVFYIMMLYKNTGLIGGKGIGIQGLSASALKSIIIPLPPLAEQKRIVAKIEELFAQIELLKQ